MIFGMDNLAIAEMLGGYMAGVTVSGVLWAIFQNNAGGAWDNAKKSFEAGVMINGEMTHKGSAAHEAAITGDTVGDPFKDTSGPSMNMLIKLTCLIGLVIAPILGGHSSETSDASHNVKVWIDSDGAKHEIKGNLKFVSEKGGEHSEKNISKEVKVEMKKTDGDKVIATVTTIITKGGEKKETIKEFKGTKAEVEAEIEKLYGSKIGEHSKMKNIIKKEIHEEEKEDHDN